MTEFTVMLHWWYVPIAFLVCAAVFCVRLRSAGDDWSTELFEFLTALLCLFMALMTALVGWWAS